MEKQDKTLKKVIGIVSWLPDDLTQRNKRVQRLDALIERLNEKLPNIDILIVAQNWKDYKPISKNNKLIVFNYIKLGILKARRILRKHFLDLNYDYLIMFDDDAIPEEFAPGAINKYLEEMDNNPDGFAFIKPTEPTGALYNPYVNSQLNFCAISRYIYEKEPMPLVDAQENEGYEDRIFSLLLHCKYNDKEFDAPAGVKSIHFKNPNINNFGGEVPSTWARQPGRNWGQLTRNTNLIEKYIVENKKLPEDLKGFIKKCNQI